MTGPATPSSAVVWVPSPFAVAPDTGDSCAADAVYRTPTSTGQQARPRNLRYHRIRRGAPDAPFWLRVALCRIHISSFARHHGKSERGSVSRILSPLATGGGNGHSSGRTVTRALKRPNPEGKSGAALARATGILLFGLAPGGVCPAALITEDPGELLPHLFTLAGSRDREGRQGQREAFFFSVSNLCLYLEGQRSLFCGTFPASRRAAVNGHPAPLSPDFPRAYSLRHATLLSPPTPL